MARKAKKGPTKHVGFYLPEPTIKKYREFYVENKFKENFESERDAVDLAVNLGIDGYNAHKTKQNDKF